MQNNNKLFYKSIITLIILLICRIGVFIPVPGIDHNEFYKSIENNGLLNFLNIFSGGGFSTIGIFALGIIPYINSSIIIQLLTKIIPSLEYLQKEEGETGKQKISQITRYFTFIWAIIQSLSIALWIKPYTFNWNNFFIIDCIITLTTGSIIVMWFAELITEYGIGNGSSLLIFQNIISNIPKNLFTKNNFNVINKPQDIILTFIIICTILMTSIIIQESKRKIRIISVKELGNENTLTLNTQNYIPLKINQGGVMPIVFASASLALPTYIFSILGTTIFGINLNNLSNNYIIYFISYSLLILIFSYLYTSIILNTKDIAKNLKKMGASIPNIRPGRETIKYLEKVVNKLTLIGAIFLFIIAQLPYFIFNIIQIKNLQGLGTTSLLILVAVSIDTAKQIQTYLISQQYDNMIE
uniref:Protein translocase subunit SecY n=1 Tax=Taenioma perpusillum TaxID=210852 RepID=A0A1Z1MR48_9FLOR|nr:SecY-type transporter protein [Taenioma perpusillum]ARW68558.1 SecY-type transporter protein [Taenioma perpusillum]